MHRSAHSHAVVLPNENADFQQASAREINKLCSEFTPSFPRGVVTTSSGGYATFPCEIFFAKTVQTGFTVKTFSNE